jgi:hypothetical protein
MIYFLQPVGGGPIKIGYSCDVARRRIELERHYGVPLVVLAEMEGDLDDERSIHQRFDHLRCGLTEQFRPTPELMGFIGRPLLASASPGAVEVLDPVSHRSRGRIIITCSEAYEDWANQLADRLRTTKGGAFDRIAAEWAAANGFDPPPPRN